MSKLLKTLRRAAFVTLIAGLAFPVSAFAGGFGDLMNKASQMKQQFNKARPSMGGAAQQFKAKLQEAAPSTQGMSGRFDTFKAAVKTKLQPQPLNIQMGTAPIANHQNQPSGLGGLRQQFDSLKNKVKGVASNSGLSSQGMPFPKNVQNTGGMQQNPLFKNMRSLVDLNLPQTPDDLFGKGFEDQLKKLQEEEAKKQGGGAGNAPPIPAPPPPPAPLPLPPPPPAPVPPPVVKPSGFEKAAVIVGSVLSNMPRRQGPVQQFESVPVMQTQYVPVAPVQYSQPQFSQPAPQYIPAPQPEVSPVAQVETSLADLVLIDIKLTAEATALAGPSYTLTFANQGLANSPKFIAAAIMSDDGSVAESAPKTLVEVPGMAASQTKEIVLRMPRGQSKFLILALDLNDNVSETDKANNVAVIGR